MKSEALKYLESRLAIGHINIPEFSALHDLLALFNRMSKLLRRTYTGDMEWCTGSRLISEEASDARKHMHSFHRLHSHTVEEFRIAATSKNGPFNPSDTADKFKVRILEQEFRSDMERLPGTKELFELISAHFDDKIYHPFLELHRQNPSHQIWELDPELTATYLDMTELYCLVATAADWASQLTRKIADYHHLCYERSEGLALRLSNRAVKMPPAVSWLSLFQEAKAAASTNVQESAPSHLCGVGQSFSAVEEAVNRRPAVSNVKYTAHSTPDTSAVQRQPAPAARRIGHVVPRVFTGSFSELEESMRKLQTPAAVIPPQIETASTEPNAKLASVTTPVSATTSSVNSSPGLRRREAIIERDVEFQDRLINGDIVRSRRPVECDTVGAARIPATDDSTHDNETITRWLNDPPSGRKRKVSKDAIKS